MKKVLFVIIFISNSLFSSEFIDISLNDYVKIVAKQKNISIVIDKNIDSKYSFFLSSKLSQNVYFDILETILRKNNMVLKFNKNHYYIEKKTKKISINNSVFSYRFHYLNEKDILEVMKLYNYKHNYVKSLKTLFIDCTSKQFKSLIEIFNQCDLLPNQKKLKITILDTNLTKIKEYGSENKLNIKENANNSFFFNLLAFPFSSTNTMTNIQKSNFTSFIKFMNSKNFTSILSSPTITIFDNKKSLFEVVKNIPYKTGQTINNDETTKTTTAITYKDVGLKVEVLPIINNNQAFLDLTLTIENILDKSETPITSKRHFKHYVSLVNGETFILSGINQTETFKNDNKTPFLGDISFFGWLFKSKKEDIKESNLTVLLELVN